MLSILPLVVAPMLASSALGQTMAPPSEPSEIVVEGSKDRNRQIRQFVDALTEAPIGGQISRFDWAVCPAAMGLPEHQNRAVAERMRRVAEAAGIRLGRADCRPNAILIAVDQKEQFIEALYRKYPVYFADEFGVPRRPRLERGVAAAWHVEGRLDSNGIPATRRIVNGVPEKSFVVSSTDSSRLQPASRPHFVAGIVVVERGALTGLTTTQLADYAAMRIFARTDPARLKGQPPTILTILDAPMDSAVPVTLTEWDLGFLKSLYASGDRQYANRRRHDIEVRMRQELARAPSDQPRR